MNLDVGLSFAGSSSASAANSAPFVITGGGGNAKTPDWTSILTVGLIVVAVVAWLIYRK